jgi:hypothetical protein
MKIRLEHIDVPETDHVCPDETQLKWLDPH